MKNKTVYFVISILIILNIIFMSTKVTFFNKTDDDNFIFQPPQTISKFIEIEVYF
jgi:hypothetical protein